MEPAVRVTRAGFWSQGSLPKQAERACPFRHTVSIPASAAGGCRRQYPSNSGPVSVRPPVCTTMWAHDSCLVPQSLQCRGEERGALVNLQPFEEPFHIAAEGFSDGIAEDLRRMPSPFRNKPLEITVSLPTPGFNARSVTVCFQFARKVPQMVQDSAVQDIAQSRKQLFDLFLRAHGDPQKV